MHRQVQRWTFMPMRLTRTSERRRKSWERRLDYDEENQIIGIAKGEELDDISQDERERIRAIKEDRSK